MAKETKIIEITNPSKEMIKTLRFSGSALDYLQKSIEEIAGAVHAFVNQDDDEVHKRILQARLLVRTSLIHLAALNGDRDFDETFFDDDDDDSIPEEVSMKGVLLFKVQGLIECATDAVYGKDTGRCIQKVTQARGLLDELLKTASVPESADKEA